MSEKASINQLLSEFHSASKSDWQALAANEIGGHDPFEQLTGLTADSLHVKPYYDKTDLNFDSLKGFQLYPNQEEFKGPRAWDNLPPVRVVHETDANKKALQHLEQGADGILFELTSSAPDFNTLLKGISIEYCSLSFIVGKEFRPESYLEYLKGRGLQLTDIQGNFFWKDLPDEIAVDFRGLPGCYGIWLPAGSPVTELSEALRLGNQHIQKLMTAQWDVGEAVSALSYSISVDTDFFWTISKLKALRFLWYQIIQAYGCSEIDPSQLYLHGRSEPWISAAFQPHGNMLKETTGAMSAILGGASGLSVYPEDLRNEVMSRIALNTSHILREESHLNKVADPLAGSYLVENMITELAENAWHKFQATF